MDADYELPVVFEGAKASNAEAPKAHVLLDKVEKARPEILKRCKHLIADKGYNDGKLFKRVWDDYAIKPVIDISNFWEDGEETRLVSGMENVVCDFCGTVYCYCPKSGLRREIAYGGFEKKKETLKYRCPAVHYGIECKGKESCPVGKAVRILLKEDRRIFTPLARSSYRWEKIYKKRSAVERVNSRLDVSFGFENHFIRRLKKMKLKIGLALCVMLAMALGRIKENQADKMLSLVKAA